MSKTIIGFKFPKDNADRWRGFNTPGIATFAGHRYRALAREIAQNSLDARDPDADPRTPVHLEFKLLEVPREEIPDLPELLQVVESVLRATRDQDKNQKAEAFFIDSLRALAAKNLKVLQITDTNTTGLVGPCVVGSPFFALVKAEGQTVKSSDTAGGSYGIGKFAPFTMSRLRTVFFSTTWSDEGQHSRMVQGRSILTSHDRDGERHDSEGYWGVKQGFLPATDDNIDLIPSWLLPKALDGHTGTAIYIMGFNDSEKRWRERIVSSLAESFFAAIQSGQLTARVEGHDLTADTLEAAFADHDILQSLKDLPDAAGALELSRDFLATLNPGNPGYHTGSTENKIFGEVRLHLIVDSKLPKRVGVIRNGMLITDRLPGLMRLNEFKPFVALLTFESDKGKALLRRMEPPAHDAIEVARLEGTEEYHAAKRELNKISRWVKEQLTHFAKDKVRDTVELDELAELFPDDKPQDGGNKDDGEMDPRGRIRIRSHPLPKRKRQSGFSDIGPNLDGGEGVDNNNEDGVPGSGDSGSANNDLGGHPGKSGGAGGGEGSSGAEGEGVKPQKIGAPVRLQEIRAVMRTANTRQIFFTPETSGPLELVFAISGADSDEPITVVSSTDGTVSGGKVKVVSVARNRMSVTVTFESEFVGSLKVSANAV
ncbi:hypothetical protein [Loktanella salsilacus]|uniref:hypothetical protein n=1 Tax=Loktanella salsilacus TaxID=195913 RepID=UPI003703B115